MKLFNRFRAILFMAAALFVVVSFSACDDTENGTDEYGLQKNTYYALEDTANGWDYGMYYNGKVIMVHADTARSTCMAFLSETKSDLSESESGDGVYIEINEDGDVVTFGTPQTLAYVVEKDDKTYLCANGDKDEVVFAEVELDEKTEKAIRGTTQTEPKSQRFVVKNKKEILKFFLDKTTDAADNAIKKKWGTKVFEPFKKAYNNLASAINIAKMMRDGKWADASLASFTKGIALQGGVYATNLLQGIALLKYDYAETKECMYDVFYGQANCDITSAMKRSDGAYEVTVKIENTYSIPQEHRETIVAADGTEKMTYVKNEVYCGVLARRAYEPEYQNCDTRSGEILVKRTDDNQELTFVIYADETYTLLRPFLMVDLDLTNKPYMRSKFQHIKYGESVPLITADVDYTYELEHYSVLPVWNKELQQYSNALLDFTLKFKATCNAMNNKRITSVKDWGVMLFNGDEPWYPISLQNENDDQSQTGNLTSESTQTVRFSRNELDMNLATYTAKPKNIYIAPYVEYTTDFNTVNTRTTIGGKLEPFAPKYIQKPAAEFTDAEYSYSKTWNPNGHISDRVNDGDINYSVNVGYANIRGTLFIDSAFVRKSGSGWDEYIRGLSYLPYHYDERERVPISDIIEGSWYENFTLYYRKDSTPPNPRYLTLELWSGGTCTESKNKLVYKPLTKENYGGNVYHIYGFKLEVE